MAAADVWSRNYLLEQLQNALLNPVRAFRPRYLPLMMVYFAYGALGLITVAQSFWIKKSLSLSPAELAAIDVWLTLPWTVKMVFGELVELGAAPRLATALLCVHRGGLHCSGLARARRSRGRLAHVYDA